MFTTQEIDFTNPQLLLQLFQKQEALIQFQAEQIALLKAKLFGKKSEKFHECNSDQLNFLEQDWEESSEEEENTPTREVKAHKRKGGRKPFPKELSRREVIHDIPAEDKICACGCELQKIGEEKS